MTSHTETALSDAIPNAIDLATLFGRIVATFRGQLALSQAALATKLGWDRSLLARLESGRNIASIENIFELEEVFVQAGLLHTHGDLMWLLDRVLREAVRRGLRPVVGRVERNQAESVDVAVAERIVVRVVDDWLLDLEQDGEPPSRRSR